MQRATLADWLRAEPFTLSLSSGFFGFFAHAGVLLALEERALVPGRVTGSSAGALVGGLFAAGLPPERIREELLSLRRQDFWDPAPGAGLLRGRRFGDRLAELLPVATFAECPIPVAVSAFDVRSRSTLVLEDGPLAPAIQASCTVPLLFHPVRHQGRALLDGGILDRAALQAVRPRERVLHHHLASRSPWRRRNSPQLAVPVRPGLTALVLPELPRVGPFRLGEGPHALNLALQRARAALDAAHAPIVEA